MIKLINRQAYLNFLQELSSEKRMIFLAGPRQVGKTTLAKELANHYSNNLYYNWDIIADKQKIIKTPTFFEKLNRIDDSIPLIVFDEIHKYKQWKNYLKGIYDQFNQDYLFLISGSGRLDLYQKAGDSLAGRYLTLHLFPLTLAELNSKKRNFKDFINNPLISFKINSSSGAWKTWHRLAELSGFPEPFTKNKKTFWVKWSKNYSHQLIHEDIRDLSNIKNINDVGLLFSLLPSKIGSPISLNSLAGDLQVSFDTVKSWMNLFDLAYLTFRISPWTKKIVRAISKEKKLYLFNYPLISDDGAKFENMVAVELYRTIYYWNEQGWGNFNLHYIKNKEQEEVDFLISNNNTPILLIETKNSDTQISKSLISFQNNLDVPAVQLVNKENIYQLQSNGKNKILVATASDWLASLP
jgi:predicted AAA+ superfamily ATPase